MTWEHERLRLRPARAVHSNRSVPRALHPFFGLVWL